MCIYLVSSVLFYYKPTSSIGHHRRPSLAKSECAESGLKTFSKSKILLSQKPMPVLWQQPLQQGEVLQCFHNIGVLTVERRSRWKMNVRNVFKIQCTCMFLKQWQNSSRHIVPEQLIQWSPVKLKLYGIAPFVIKGIEARDKRNIKS